MSRDPHSPGRGRLDQKSLALCQPLTWGFGVPYVGFAPFSRYGNLGAAAQGPWDSSAEKVNSMAIARCEQCGPPSTPPEPYTHRHTAAPGSGRGVRCGAGTCLNMAFVWLTASEQRSYLAGERFFRYSSHAPEVELI
jgi:hypothetical protein